MSREPAAMLCGKSLSAATETVPSNSCLSPRASVRKVAIAEIDNNLAVEIGLLQHLFKSRPSLGAGHGRATCIGDDQCCLVRCSHNATARLPA
jgi:hypothetical protein